jgi:two-component response regulator (ARR-B family)
MFGRWLNGVRKDDTQKIWIGVSALCWDIWKTKNDIIFNKQSGTNFLQVIRRAAHSIQQWVFLFPLEKHEDMVIGCNQMLVVAHDFFFQATG